MKKVILILGILVLLTGCTVNYNLEISDGVITENISGEINRNEFDDISEENGDHTIYHLLFDKQSAVWEGEELYNQDVVDNSGKISFNYNYQYNNFADSRVLKSCFNNAVFNETDDYYYFSISGAFNCQYADNIKVNITSDMAALENNAEKVEGNTYTWNLKAEKEADIFLILSKKIKHYEHEEKSLLSTFQIISYITLAILIVLVLILYKIKKNKKDY